MIRDYFYKPEAIFHRTSDETPSDSEILMGAEVEVDDCGRDRKSQIEGSYSQQFPTFTYQKDDVSLHNGGFEVVSHPATLNYHMNGDARWAERLSFLDGKGCRAHKTTTCGLHIHVNKSSMSEDEQVKFGVFFNRFRNQMEKIARRPNNPLYANYTSIPSSIGVREGRRLVVGHNRHVAVNYTNSKTIEVRIFKGTLNGDTLKAAFQLVHAVVRYVKRRPLSGITQPDTVVEWKNFCLYVAENGYDKLVAYMQKRQVWAGVVDDDTEGERQRAELEVASVRRATPRRPRQVVAVDYETTGELRMATPRRPRSHGQNVGLVIRQLVREDRNRTVNDLMNILNERGIVGAYGTVARQRREELREIEAGR